MIHHRRFRTAVNFNNRVGFALVALIAGVFLIGMLACQSSTPTLVRATATPAPTPKPISTSQPATRTAVPTPVATVSETQVFPPSPRTETPQSDDKPVLEAADATCLLGQESFFDVRLSLIEDGGLAGYDMVLNLEPNGMAQFISVEFPNQGFGMSSDLPDISVNVSYLNTERTIQPGDRGTRLATIGIRCSQLGTGVINLTVLALDDELGAVIDADVRSGSIIVNN